MTLCSGLGKCEVHSCGDIGGTEEAGHKVGSLPNVRDSGPSMHFSVLSAKDRFVALGARGFSALIMIMCVSKMM